MKYLTEEEQKEKLAKQIAKQKEKPKYGRDGFVEVGEEKVKYLGVSYLVKVLKYYNHTDNFAKIMSNRQTVEHVVVEFPEETRAIVNVVKRMDEWSEFLWHDTLHGWNDDQSLDEQIAEMHRIAQEDIESLKWGKIYFKVQIERIRLFGKKVMLWFKQRNKK